MIAVTGANGLLGSFVIRKLIDTHTPFIALKRENSDISLLNDVVDKITWRDADILNPESLYESFADVTGVIHCAAMVSFNPRDEERLQVVNVEGTRNVVNACLLLDIKRLLHVSSVAALGRQKDQTLITETNLWKDSPFNTVYGISKYKAELEIFRGQEEGLSTIIVNPSVILAPGNWDKSSAKLFKYAWKERPFYTDGSLNYVDARDVASIIYQLYFSTLEGERFIASGGTTTIKTFFDTLCALLNKKAPGIKLSKSVLQIVAKLELWRSYLTGSAPLITQETARLADTFFGYDNQKVKNALQYQFQTVDDTLGWCAEFYRKQTELKN
ncbi:MAG: NAD-dependent epimerase/dehydratase family protein [Cyclobacteriaceae bacterium]|nr:NAD-dependent epimerase/dehydratase family protein [Cyclobacteriaceae bacterium]